jgi:hypothetical protein
MSFPLKINYTTIEVCCQPYLGDPGWSLTILAEFAIQHINALTPDHNTKYSMKYYHAIEINNLDVIQQKVFELFPKNCFRLTKLFYPPDNLDTFFGIPELKTELDRLGLSQHVDAFAFYVVQKTKGSTLHTDTGDRKYSFNIPIKFCKNTTVNFYTTDSEPTVQLHGEGVDYNKYELENCTLVDSLELNMPHIINVKEVHNICNNNNIPRITLLVRLKHTIDLDHLFI